MLTGLVGLSMRDVALTRDEDEGLMAGLLKSDKAPNGTSRRADWLDDNADCLGRWYVSEVRRNYRGYSPSRQGGGCDRPCRPCYDCAGTDFGESHRINHISKTVLSIVKFGGPGRTVLSLSQKADIFGFTMFWSPSFDGMADLTPYFNHVIASYTRIQTVPHVLVKWGRLLRLR